MSRAEDAQHWSEMAFEMADNLRDRVESGEYEEAAGPFSASHELCDIASKLAAALDEASGEQEGQDESGALVEKPAVVEGILGKRFFYFTHHKELANGKGAKMYGYRTDVTEAVSALIEREIVRFIDYCAETYGVDLWHITDDGGILGLDEKTGHEYLNTLIQEWRAS